MTNAILFAQALIKWQWTTPIWLFSVGITIGLLVCFGIVLIGYGLSHIPGLNEVNEKPKNRVTLALILTVVTHLILIPFYWMPNYVDWMSMGHHLGAYQPFSKITESATNPPGESALILAILMMTLALFVGWLTFFALCSKKLMSEIGVIIMEGPLGWLVWIGVYFVFIAVLGVVLDRANGFGANLFLVQKSVQKLKPITELATTGVSKVMKFEISPDEEKGQAIDVSFVGNQLRGMEIWSSQKVEIQATPFVEKSLKDFIVRKRNIQVDPESPTEVLRPGIPVEVIPNEKIDKLYVKNESSDVATLELRVITQPTVPEVGVVPFCVLVVVGIFMFYIFCRGVMPKVSAIALSTFKTEVSQPVYLLLIIVSSIAVLLFVILPYNTFGEDIKMLKDAGLTLILVISIFLAIWASSKSIAEEIEGRTALTVLSKPIGRRQFIVGKFLGIAWALAIFAIIVGLIFFIPAVSYKTTYDARERAAEPPKWEECYAETARIAPGIALGFLETLIFIAISVTISTRLPIMANILICFFIYVLGHLTPLIVQSNVAVDAFAPVRFFGQLIATILPVLDHFNIQAAISGDAVVPIAYLGWAILYCMIYGTISLLLGLILFEDRDVA